MLLFFEKLIATQLVKKCFSFHGNKMFLGLLDSVLSQTKPVSIYVPDRLLRLLFILCSIYT
jgi:hypothetical protein